MATVDLKDVKKVYAGGVEAVKGVSIAIPDKALCVLVGPSGCGKSTLLRMIAGLETITSGTCSFDGQVVNAIGPTERDIAMVFQNYALYPHMTVYDNMAYGLRNRGMAKDEIDKRVQSVAKTLELAHLLDRRPRELSGGQRQRVAMGRAIVRNPKVFLFDEPLSNLDAKLRVQMRVEIKKLQRTLGVTSVYVTHDQLEAMTLADLLVVMNAGQVEQMGNPRHLREAGIDLRGELHRSPPMNLHTHRWQVQRWLNGVGLHSARCGHVGFPPGRCRYRRRTQPGLRLDAVVQGVSRWGQLPLLRCCRITRRRRVAGRSSHEVGEARHIRFGASLV
jgi:sn-glycerol 3-phosphate transport system ATP-binding protein